MLCSAGLCDITLCWELECKHAHTHTHTFQKSEMSLKPFLSGCVTRLQNAGPADGAGREKLDAEGPEHNDK